MTRQTDPVRRTPGVSDIQAHLDATLRTPSDDELRDPLDLCRFEDDCQRKLDDLDARLAAHLEGLPE